MPAGPDDGALAATYGVVHAINDAHQRAFQVVRRLPGGFQEGAYEIGEADARLVLKWHTRPVTLERLEEVARIVSDVRRAGWPTPAWHVVGITPNGERYTVTDFVEGEHPEVLSPALLEELLALNALQAGLAPATKQEWSGYASDVVFNDRSQMLSAIASNCEAGRRLERAVAAMCAGGEAAVIPADDLVSGVFALENILFRDGAVAAVIDVEAIGRGCRVFDLAVLYARVRADEVPVEGRLRRAAEDVAGPLVFRICLAAEVIGLLAFGVTHWPENVPRACAAWARRFETLTSG